jgi:fucose permease
MTKWILGGALLTLGIIKLADMVQEQPSVGIPVAIVLTILWIIQMEKDYRGARK